MRSCIYYTYKSTQLRYNSLCYFKKELIFWIDETSLFPFIPDEIFAQFQWRRADLPPTGFAIEQTRPKLRIQRSRRSNPQRPRCSWIPGASPHSCHPEPDGDTRWWRWIGRSACRGWAEVSVGHGRVSDAPGEPGKIPGRRHDPPLYEFDPGRGQPPLDGVLRGVGSAQLQGKKN